MKKRLIYLLLAAVAAAIPASAVTPKAAKARIDQIRKVYASARQLIAMGQEEPNVINQFTVSVNQMYPGSGPHQEKLTVYFTLDEPEDLDNGEIWTNNLYFAENKYNIAAHEFSEEFLFDERTGELMFYIFNYPDENENPASARLYFDKGKLISTIPEKIDFDDHSWGLTVEGVLFSANRVKTIFDTVIGHSH